LRVAVLGGIERDHTVSARTRIHKHMQHLLGFVALADIAVLVVSMYLAWELRLKLNLWAPDIDPAQALYSSAGPWIGLLWLVWLAGQGAYAPRHFGSGSEEFKDVFMGSLLTAGTVGLGCYLFQIQLARGFLVLVFVIGIPLLLIERYVARKLLHRARIQGRLQHKVLAVGGPSGVNELVEVLNREQYVGYRIVGACIPSQMEFRPEELSVPVLGSVAEARLICDEIGADTVLVARGAYTSASDLRRIGWDLEESDIDLVVVPSLLDVAGPRIHMRPVAGLPLLHVEGPQVDEAAGFSKRIFDLVVASAVLIATAPLALLVMLWIKAEDGGPVFFRQHRIGRNGESFDMLKFRSMVVDAEWRLEEIEHMNESDSVLFKVRNDPRVTRIGRVLRKYSIDELPQLVNVLRGDMSLVGPRPPLAREVEAYADDVHRRLLVRPGMTGLWQVSGRSELSWKESVRLDLYYVDNWSMMGDLVIMAKTVKAVFASHGAY
jgi:exopolysaccharide biosynthesis polyprenyl glycosylphosphotransferase